jgi:hypothetical protein
MVSPNDRLRLPPPWISPAAGMPDREVRPVIIVQRRRLFYPSYVQDYLDRVTAADVAAGNTSGLELGVTDGANTFIQDLVNDGLLGVSGGVISQAASVMKASVPMAGARTRLGAMTPLVGAGPTSFNFVDGDYNRKTGLVGDGSTRYLNSNRNNNADPQDSNHNAAWLSQGATVGGGVIGTDTSSVIGSNNIFYDIGGNGLFFRNRALSLTSFAGAIPCPTGFIGHSRSAAASFLARANLSTITVTQTSGIPYNGNIFVFRRGTEETNARLAFYSIGESLDLAILDARVTALISAYAAAIP